jgi:hypothetical protein
MFGQQDVPSVAAFHYALRHVDSGANDVGFIVNIRDAIDGTAVNAHPQPYQGIISHCFADLQRTDHGFFGTPIKQQCHAIAGRYTHQFVRCFRRPERLRFPNDVIELLQQLNLLVHEQFRVTDDVN